MRNPRVEEEVLREYEASLVVPPQPQRRLFLLCPVGLVGAGKSTVVKPLAEKLRLVRISGDEIRKLLKEHGLDYDAVRDLRFRLIKKYLSGGYSVAIDSDTASPATEEIIEESERTYGALPIWIHINPPENFILNKLQAFKHTWLFKDADDAIANYQRRKPLHENLGLPFLYSFDTSKDNLMYEINKAAAKIEKSVQR